MKAFLRRTMKSCAKHLASNKTKHDQTCIRYKNFYNKIERKRQQKLIIIFPTM